MLPHLVPSVQLLLRFPKTPKQDSESAYRSVETEVKCSLTNIHTVFAANRNYVGCSASNASYLFPWNLQQRAQ